MLTMRQVTKATELKRFKELEGEYHYMGETHSGGDTMRLVFEEDGKWVALMVWGSACYHIKPRDAYVGWANSVKAIARFAKRLTMAQRRALCMPRAKSKAGVVAKHEYKVPCHVTLHNFLRALDLDDFGEKLSGWMASQGDGTLPRQLALDVVVGILYEQTRLALLRLDLSLAVAGCVVGPFGDVCNAVKALDAVRHREAP